MKAAAIQNPVSSRFDYLIERVRDASFETVPFKHIYLEALFHPEDFAQLMTASQITLPAAKDDEDLFRILFEHDYKIIHFPGCSVDEKAYMKWHAKKDAFHDYRNAAMTNTACEGFGMTLRLVGPRDPFLIELNAFIASDAFNQALADKFGVEYSAVYQDNGIQKYLDGYEISPHPDIRKKALTFMVNINPDPNSEAHNHHTRYLSFTERYRYVEAFWQGNPDIDRGWVPWDWCEEVKQQRANNSMVVFAPDDTTMHGVKAHYEHLQHQRTQLYGNLWYREAHVRGELDWDALEIALEEDKHVAPQKNVANMMPSMLKKLLRKMRSDDSHHHIREQHK